VCGGSAGLSSCLIVHVVGFWDRQINELLTGVGQLLGGGAPLTPSTPSPSPMLPLPPHEPSLPPPSTLPEFPRSTLDGIHGTDSNPMPILRPPGDLGPYGTHEIAPGVWMPDGFDDLPEPPGQTDPAGFSGAAADAATTADAALRRDRAARKDTDAQLGPAVSRTHVAAADTQQRLRDLDSQIRAGVAALQPTMDTVAGGQQMAEFLMTKSREVKAVITDATNVSRSQARVVGALAQRYSQIGGPRSV
jgi:hypothetical protein